MEGDNNGGGEEEKEMEEEQEKDEEEKDEDRDEDKVLNMEAIAKACCCPICFETFNASDHAPVGTPCYHWFCSSCVEIFLPAHQWRCPICRQPAPRKSLRHDLSGAV